ncbi:MAG: TIGR03620 family F420-dependent LLM class oxidoreductase [Actinobacteria bacterium]|nr:TIGR03620 family F420-dependent LLM class oxidoreductase [Actinomycetota bacterium]
MRDLGKVGVWLGPIALEPAAAERTAARELEELGYGSLWFGESPFNREAFAHAATLLGATERIVVATGIATIWARDGIAMANGANTLAEAFPGRFLLGIGVSHRAIAPMRNKVYARPLTDMRAYLDEMDAAQYRLPAPAEPAKVVIAALAPRMLALAAERTAGTHPYLVTPEHTRLARETVGAGKLVLPEQAVVLTEDADAARAAGRDHLALYLTLENYVSNWRRLGFEDADFDGGGSDRLVDALVAWGDEEAIAARVREHLDAGADHVAVQAVGSDSLGQLRRLAPTLTSL